ncbi:MAG: lamin tail domain-containing protein [Methanomassiliicoccales archaeon]|nr:lamin tail domain-containing protein [Methanomassiliicoccales archaeon]
MGGGYDIRIRQGQDEIVLSKQMGRRIWLPLPLLQDRVQDFELAVSSQKGSLEGIVRYEIASLAQYRVLEGYGTMGIDGALGTEALLSEEDVHRAVGLALLLVQMEIFGSFDPVSAQCVLDMFPVSVSVDELRGMMGEAEEVDPADIYLTLSGAGHLDMRWLLAQTLYAASDILVMRWLDYLQVLDLAEALERISTASLASLNDFLESALGQDIIGEATMQWMTDRLASSGLDEMAYRWQNEEAPDAMVLIDDCPLYIIDAYGEQLIVHIGGEYPLDFPTTDVLASDIWKGFVIEYRQESFELARIIHSFVQWIASGLADGLTIGMVSLKLDCTDGIPFYSEVLSSLDQGLAAMRPSLDSAIGAASSEFKPRDPLAEGLVRFINDEREDILQMDSCVEAALDVLASQAVHAQLDGLCGLDPLAIEALAQNLAHQWKYDGLMGVRTATEEAFLERGQDLVDIYTRTFGNLTMAGMPREFHDALALLSKGAARLVPGVDEAISEACARTLDDMLSASRLRSDAIFVRIRSPELHLDLGNGAMAVEHLVPQVMMPWLSNPPSLQTVIAWPTSWSSAAGGPNLHIIDPSNLTLAAYQSAFSLRIQGAVSLTLACSGSLSSYLAYAAPLEVTSEVPIAFSSSISCSSSWPLVGVDYCHSATLLEGIAEVFDKIWKGVVDAFGWLSDAANRLFSFLQDLVDRVVAYATGLIQTISDMLLSLVDRLRNLVDGALSAFISWLGSSISASFGNASFSLEFGGLSFLFDFSSTSILLGKSKEYLRVTMSTILLGAQLSVSARFVDIYRHGPDLIVDMSLAAEGWSAECAIDPRMAVMDHFAEVKAIFSDCILEMQLPVLASYERASFRLSDLPGIGDVLSRIPVPIPGLTASIDAGFEIKYDNPIADHPVINEVELNPPGADAGNEWMELYNPTSDAMDLTGWTLGTVHGHQSLTMLDVGMMAPKSRAIVRFEGQTLDNGDESGIPAGESLALYDADGMRVDSLPFLNDFYNDRRTWQRAFDGSDRWVFKDESGGGANGLMVLDLSDGQRFLLSLMEAVVRAFSEANEQILDLDALGRIIERAIREVVETLLETLARSIMEMSVFLEVALQDYSQSIDGRLRLALVVTGEGVRDALLWLAEAVYTALENICSPGAVATCAHSLGDLLDDVYIRFGALAGVGLPKLLSPTALDQRFLFGGMVDVNLATFIASKEGHKGWCLRFGALFEGVPGAFLSTMYPVEADQLVDYWVMRAEVRSLGEDEEEPLDVWSV